MSQNAPGSSSRSDRRSERVDAGVEALATWLRDQVDGGLAGLEKGGSTPFTRQAARLVDAQAPGLARRVTRLAEVPGSHDGWPDALLDGLGALALLVAAWRRIDDLPEPLVESVRAQVGFRTRRDDVLASGPRARGVWTVVGQVTSDDDDLRSRRTWLVGEAGSALLLEFVYGYGEFEPGLSLGTSLDATLAFYPGALRQRAVVAARHGAGEGTVPRGTIAQVWASFASALAADPWTSSAVGVVTAACDDAFQLTDATGSMPLAGEPWELLAVSGGQPVDVAVEWTGRRATALSVCVDGAWVGLG